MSTSEVESALKTPEWLEALENKRKRPHKLAHEIGAGAPCFICKDRCKGLNLHFWRKLCIECKCKKEDHEIEEEDDYAQFEILFGTKKGRKTIIKFNAQKKSFDWVPPNVSSDLVTEYLKSIPQSKLPISNTEGARYRKQQLEKQLPLHDVDPNVCHNLSVKETHAFEKYLDNLRNNVIGQGKIMKYQKTMFIKNLSNQLAALSENCGNTKPQIAEVRGQIAIDAVPIYNSSSDSVSRDLYIPNDLNATSNNNSRKNFQTINSSTGENLNSKNRSVSPRSSEFISDRFEFNRGEISSATKAGQKCISDTHGSLANYHQSLDKEQNNNNNNLKQGGNIENIKDSIFGQKYFPPISENIYSNEEKNYFPKSYEKTDETKACTESLFKHALNKFEELKVSSSELPIVPMQETKIIASCKGKGLDNMMKDLYVNNIKNEMENTFPAPPETCQECLGILNPEEVVIQAERAGNLALWHAKCFVCYFCKELLVDLMYFFHHGKVYCGRHYAGIMNIPRCYACDELIFVKEYTCAEGENYHFRHFCCFICDRPLGGMQYVPKDNQPICLNCYTSKFGKKCRTCSSEITALQQRVSWKDLDYHATPACFRCANCLKSLLQGKFMVKNDNIFCSKECVAQFLT